MKKNISNITFNILIYTAVDIWRKTRGIVQPLYGKKELKFYIPEMNRIIHQFVRNMNTLACKNEEFDVCERLSNITVNIIMSKE